MSDQRRKNNRVALHCTVAITFTEVYSATLADLSLGGCFIQCSEVVRPGQQFDLRFNALGREVKARAVVRWVRPGEGFGAQIMRMDLLSSQSLHGIVCCLRGDRAPVLEVLVGVGD